MTADDEMTTVLRRIGNETDGVPEHVLAGARAAFAWRTIDAELAALAHDSAVDGALAVRGQESPRLLSFTAPQITVDVEVTEIGDHRRLLGQLVPPAATRLEVRHAEGMTPVEADDLGRFVAEHLPPGPVSIRCHLASAERPVVVDTDWLTI